MNRFERAVTEVLRFEGGLSNDPQDPGGLTGFGISARAFPTLNIEAITRWEAVKLYRALYWNPTHCELLPWPLAFCVFDAAVQHGPVRASRWLQAALGVKPDGLIGPLTLGAIPTSPEGRREVVTGMLIDRVAFYLSLPTFDRFGRGWMNRIVYVARIVYTDDQP